MDDNLRKLVENEQKKYKDLLNKTIEEEMTPEGE